MHNTVYKVTNKSNGRYYIGQHQTKNLDDGYMGSGRLIRQAIKKYGKEKFTKHILHILETKAEMNAKEKELVNPNDPMSYNLWDGGKGRQMGYKHSKKTRIKISQATRGKTKAPQSDHHKQNISQARQGMKFSQEHRQNISIALAGRKLTDNHKQNISASLLGHPNWYQGKVN